MAGSNYNGSSEEESEEESDDDDDFDDDDEDSDEDSDIDNNATPLSRDDVAKLLLLVSKAYSIQTITATQRSKIKDEIILQKGYLRPLLLQNNKIPDVLAILATFPV